MDITPLTDTIALVSSGGKGRLLADLPSGLDLIGAAWGLKGCEALIVHSKDIDEAFFDLRTKLAGELLQKFTNYNLRIGIVGDFSGYGSKSLADFIRESNRGRTVCFAPSVEEAVAHLSR